MRTGLSIFSFIVVVLLSGCQTRKTIAPSKLDVFVSILPVQYFVERIGGAHVHVSPMVLPGMSPHSYEPRPSQMADLTQCRAYFAIGIEFENAWLPRFAEANPQLRIVHLDNDSTKIAFAEHADTDSDEMHTETKATNDTHHHSHIGLDPHTWLSPERVKYMGAIIRDALKELDPAHAADYDTNYAQFKDSLVALQSELKRIVETKTKFMVFHPSWGYFADEFGLEQIPIEVDGKEPSPRELAHIIDFAKSHHIRTIFVQPQFSRKTAMIIAGKINGVCKEADDLAYDWPTNLRAVAQAIAEKQQTANRN